MVKVNGEIHRNLSGLTFREALHQLNYPEMYIAVECNGTIVPKKDYDLRVIQDGDQIEVVRFVGGG